MAFPTAVNSQITDAVTQSSVQVLGSSGGMALASLLQATAQAMANAAHNATAHQQNQWITAQAATAAGVALIYRGVGIAAPPAPPSPQPSPPPSPEA